MISSLERRLIALEASVKPQKISTWSDFMVWLDAHDEDPEPAEANLSPKLQAFVEEILNDQFN